MRQFDLTSGRRMKRVRARHDIFFLGEVDLPATGVELSMRRTEDYQDTLKKKLMEAAAQVAISQMAISIGSEIAFSVASTAAAAATTAGAAALAAGASASTAAIAGSSVVPIVGWAVAAIIAIGTFVGGRIGKRRAEEAIADGKKQIQRYGDETQATVKAAQMAVADAEYPAAESLAASNAPLEGLGSFLGIRKSQITHAVAKAQVYSIQKPGQLLLRTGQMGARLVGDKRGEEYAKMREKKWVANSDRVQKMFERKLDNPYKMVANDIDTIGRTVSGQQVAYVTQKKVGELVKRAKQDMDEYRDKTLAAINTPEYREAVRVNIAKGLRGDPDFAGKVNEIRARDKMIDSEFMSSQQVAAAAPGNVANSTGGSGLLATAATIASAFFLLRP
jgi:hypothetical protein